MQYASNASVHTAAVPPRLVVAAQEDDGSRRGALRQRQAALLQRRRAKGLGVVVRRRDGAGDSGQCQAVKTQCDIFRVAFPGRRHKPRDAGRR